MKVSLKASDVHMAVDAYRLFSLQSDYPLHLGITEAGTLLDGFHQVVHRHRLAPCRTASAIRFACLWPPIRWKK